MKNNQIFQTGFLERGKRILIFDVFALNRVAVKLHLALPREKKKVP